MMVINARNIKKLVPTVLRVTQLSDIDCARFVLAMGYYMLGVLYFDDKVTWDELEGVEEQAKMRAFGILEGDLEGKTEDVAQRLLERAVLR